MHEEGLRARQEKKTFFCIFVGMRLTYLGVRNQRVDGVTFNFRSFHCFIHLLVLLLPFQRRCPLLLNCLIRGPRPRGESKSDQKVTSLSSSVKQGIGQSLSENFEVSFVPRPRFAPHFFLIPDGRRGHGQNAFL